MSLSLQPGCKSLECATVMSGTVESWKNYGLAKKKPSRQLLVREGQLIPFSFSVLYELQKSSISAYLTQ